MASKGGPVANVGDGVDLLATAWPETINYLELVKLSARRPFVMVMHCHSYRQ